MLNHFDDTELIQSARATNKGGKLWKELIVIILVSVFGTLLTQALALLPVVMMARDEMNELQMTVVSLYATFATTVGIIMYCMYVQKRSARSIGFTSNKVIVQYIKGLLIGLIMFSTIVGLGYITKAFNFIGVEKKINLGMLSVILVGFFFQGMSEEVLCRGYIMTSVSRKHSVLLGIIINSLVFALMHVLNPGFGILPFVNLVLFGVFASFYMLKTGDIWGVSAIHSIWNFVQGSLYGLSVSGTNPLPTILKFEITEKTILNGGTFGPEGGLIVTGVLLIGIVVLLLRLPPKPYTIKVGKEDNIEGNEKPVAKN